MFRWQDFKGIKKNSNTNDKKIKERMFMSCIYKLAMKCMKTLPVTKQYQPTAGEFNLYNTVSVAGKTNFSSFKGGVWILNRWVKTVC